MGEHLVVPFSGKEVLDRFSNTRADLFHVFEFLTGGGAQAIHAAKAVGQQLGGALADIANAQGEDDPGQRSVLGCFDGGDDVGGRFLAHAFQAGDLLLRQRVNVGQAVQQVALHELFDELLSHALDVHRSP